MTTKLMLLNYVMNYNTMVFFFFSSMAPKEHCSVNNTSPHHAIIGFPLGRVDPDVGRLDVSFSLPQPDGM